MTPFQQGHFINQLTGNLFASSVGVVSVISLFIIMFSFLGRFGARELLGRNEPPYICTYIYYSQRWRRRDDRMVKSNSNKNSGEGQKQHIHSRTCSI